MNELLWSTKLLYFRFDDCQFESMISGYSDRRLRVVYLSYISLKESTTLPMEFRL